jgi:replicative superfamily II helicase
MFLDWRSRTIPGLLSHQADLIRAYAEKAAAKSDVALQLPTGSGKTLVGLILGEWRRRKYGERVVYLCPTRQLVHQVTQQAKEQYGLRVNAFVKK